MTPFDANERAALDEHGYVVREGVFSEARCTALCQRLSELIVASARRQISGALPSLAFWSLMPRSVDDAVAFWDLSRHTPSGPPETWESSVMRVGHGLHLVDGEFAAACQAPELTAPLASVGAVAVVQSAVVYKQPHSESVQFGLHQDSWYLPSEPDTLLLAFVALDHMDRENGCLEVVPGSHRLPRQATLTLGPGGFVSVDGRPQGRPPDGAVALPMRRGSVAFLHGLTFNGSAPNRSAGPRRALIVHTLGAGSRMLPSSWVQAPAAGFASLSVKT